MKSTTLGRTGLSVSRIGLGLAALGRPGYINLGHSADLRGGRDLAAMRSQAHSVLDLAWSSGVRHFDAARSYGQSEAFLAGWLGDRGISAGEVTVGSKWGYVYTAGWAVEADRHEVKDHSAANLDRQSAESRAILGDHLKLYQIHSATRESGVLEDPAVLDGLARLQAQGWAIGLSTSGPRQAETIRRALEIAADGLALFDSVQATWNLLEPSAGPALAEAHRAGLGVIVKEALANGRLTTRNDDPAFGSARVLLEAESARLRATPDALAIAAALAQPWADVVLSGASAADQFRSNLRALEVPWDDPVSSALGALAETPDDYWATRARLPWN